MDIRSKEFEVAGESLVPTEEDLALINGRFALKPLTADQVYVRRLAVCNDLYDRTGERFPGYYLERFAETLPGKPLLAHHDKGQYPLGRFFRAEVVTEPYEARETRPGENGGEPGRPPVTWLYCWAYLVKTPANEEIRTQIDAGVYSHVSIGFRWADLACDLCGRSYFAGECPHVIDREYDGRRCTATYAGDPGRVEAIEASLVYLGAQYGAVVTKSDDRKSEKEALVAAATADPALAADGQRYREDLQREIQRLASCLHAEPEAELVLSALTEPTAERLKRLLNQYRERFDRHFGVARRTEEETPSNFSLMA